jgi:uncharacterized integral membrane protein (TIGR00698 family)
MNRIWRARVPGFFLVVAVAIVAFVLGRIVPLIGGPVFGIVLGMAITAWRAPAATMQPGLAFASKQVLQFAIVLLGANLTLHQLGLSGWRAVPIMLGTLVLVLAAAYFLGRAFGLERNLRRLLGVGTAICGGSAIAAVSTAIGASEEDIAYSISVVFLFNIVAVLIFPPLGHLLALSQHAFGVWAGTAINDTSSVVAAAYTYGRVAGDEAVITKLTRTTLIIPLVVFYAGKRIWSERNGGRVDWQRVIPWFIVWFAVAAALNTFGVIPAQLHAVITPVALFMIVLAMSAIGLSANFKKMRAAGTRPILLGFILWVLIATSSLALIHIEHLD